MSEKQGRSRINGSAKWKLIIFLKCVACFQLVECQDSSVRENLKDCGGEYSGYQYVISSPNYPAPYPRKQSCIFTLRGSPLATCDQTFNLQFLDFSLSPSENCADDYVEIGDRSLFCGKVVGIRKYASKDNTLVLRFRSGATLGDKGFRILVTTLPCTPEQINEKIREKEKLEQSGGTLGNRVTDKYVVSGNAASQKDAQSHISSYRKLVRGEVASPPRVESLVESEEKDLLREHEQQPQLDRAPVDHLEVPVNGIKLFRASPSLQSESVAPSTVQSIEDKPSKISAYLFVPPTEFRPPNQWNTEFHDQKSNSTRNLAPLQRYQAISDKFAIPAKTYGVPDTPYYPSLPNSVPGIKTGEVLDNPGGWIDCQGKNNLQPDLEVATTFRGNRNRGLVNNFRGGQGFDAPFYPTTYASPDPPVPAYVPNQNVGFNPSPQYGLPAGGYPNENVPGVNGPDRPIYPPNNFNGYQNLIPTSGGSVNDYPLIPNPINNGQLALCCNVYYSGQRFLLASPGFPSASYSANPFECAYSIIPYSPNTCSMRFNFKFFNHGIEDAFCSNGHIEIDGRRFCGCKKGLTLVSVVTSAFPKILRLRYTGYPRTKFNGFLIEVIQEPCPNNSGYLSRSKKEIADSSSEIGRSFAENNTTSGNSTGGRARRDLGYSYPKPIFGLVEEPGSGQSWKSGYVPRGQPWGQQGAAGNLLSPLFSCQAFSFLDWIHAAKEAYLRNGRCLGTNSPPGNIIPDTIVPANPGSGGWNYPCADCQDINVVEGIVSSPQYPTNYPDNVRKCFRFYRAPESCYLELVIFDFELEYSNGCTKDYVTFSGSSDRYCGSSLAGKRTSFDISRGQSLVMCFVTDSYGSRRGFSAGFSQIPCQGLVNR